MMTKFFLPGYRQYQNKSIGKKYIIFAKLILMILDLDFYDIS